MKIDAFRTLNAVLRGGSFAAAATDVNLSPSAVSLQMKQLEEHFGQPLFDRSALQARPNAFAHEVDGIMQEALGRLDALRRRSSPDLEGVLRLGTIEPLQATLLPPLLRHAQDHYPKLDLRIVRGRVKDLLDMLKGGAIDAAIVTRSESTGSNRLHWLPLYKEPLTVIAPPDSSDNDIAALFRKYAWIRFDKSTVGGRAGARYIAAHAPEARCKFELLSLAAITALVSEGLGVSIIPEPGPNLYRAHPVRVLRLGRNGPHRQISFVCRQTDKENRLVQTVHAATQAALRRLHT